jgi:esterase/lipase superfamily enzyme
VRALRTQAAPEVKPPTAGASVLQVFYASDRTATGSLVPGKAYGYDRGKITYGLANVSIPPGHKTGAVETPTIWRLEFSPSFDKDIVAITPLMPQSANEFFRLLSLRVDRSGRREVFVFVPGFNVTFEEALFRTAELAYDLAPYDGAPILYSWPSRGGPLGWNPLAYYHDEQQVNISAQHLHEFLQDVARRTNASVVNVIAHSMGSRVLAYALREPVSPKLGSIVMAAADIDVEEFRGIAGAIRAAGNKVTLYDSATDEALALSKKAHGYEREGQFGPHTVIMPDVFDTIDATGVDTSMLGHSLGRVSIITDIFNVFQGVPPPRIGLHEQNGAPKYWRLTPE